MVCLTSLHDNHPEFRNIIVHFDLVCHFLIQVVNDYEK